MPKLFISVIGNRAKKELIQLSKRAKGIRILPKRSVALVPKNSPLIVTLVPGGPSLGDIPVTTGGGPIVYYKIIY